MIGLVTGSGRAAGGESWTSASLPELLDQIDADVASMTADGAYDGETAYSAVARMASRGCSRHSTLGDSDSEQNLAAIAEPSPRLGSAQTSDGGEDRIQRAQPDDMARSASHCPGRVVRDVARNAATSAYSCIKAG
jgi:hypothetical protein